MTLIFFLFIEDEGFDLLGWCVRKIKFECCRGKVR